MKLKSGLVIVLVLSAVLASTLAGKPRRKLPTKPKLNLKEKLIANDGTLMPHVKEEELLSKEHLVEQFEQLNYEQPNHENQDIPDPVRVSQILYKAKDKASMEVVPEIFVEELIAQNSFKDLSECSVLSFKKRADLLDRVVVGHGEIYQTIASGFIHSYLSALLLEAAKKCVDEENFEEVSKKYNSREWLNGLREAIDLDANIVDTSDSWEDSEEVLSVSEICPSVLTFVKTNSEPSHDTTLEPTVDSAPADQSSANEPSSTSVVE